MARILAIAALLLLAAPVSVQGTPAFANAQLYERVVERLFQHEVSGRTTAILLRYTYCDAGEMQLFTSERSDGKVEAELWSLPPGSPTIWNQLAQLTADHPKWDAKQLASSIEVHRDSLSVPPSSALFRLLVSERPQQASLAGDDKLLLESSQYELTISSLSKNLSVTARGPQNAESSGDPLIRWMGQVRAYVERGAAGKVDSPTAHK